MQPSFPSTTVSGSFWPPPAGAAGGAPAPAKSSSIPDSFSPEGARAALELIGRARSGSDDSPALGSALDKMHSFTQVTLECGVDSAIARIMVAQGKQARDQIGRAASDIKDHFTKLKAQNQKELKQIRERIAARKKAAKWGLWGKIFKAVGAALCAASSIFTGPAGMVGAALLLASLVVSCTVKGDAGKWVSLGLSLAAAAVSLGSSLIGSGVGSGGSVAETALQVSSRAADLTSHGCTVGKGFADRDAMEAQAALMEIRAIVEKLRGENDDGRDEIEMLIEADSRCMDQVLKALESHNQTTLSAASV